MNDLEKDVNKILKKLDLHDMLTIIKYIYSLERENENLFKDKLQIEKDLTGRIHRAIEYLEEEGLSNYEKKLYNILLGSE